MKMNWGHGIALVIIGFVSFMGFLTFRCFQMPSFLVREDYYEASLDTDEIIAAAGRGHSLLHLTALEQGDSLFILGLMPQWDVNTPVEFSAYFPSNPELDWAWSGVPVFNSSGEFAIKRPDNHVTSLYKRYLMKWSFQKNNHLQNITIRSVKKTD